MTRNWSGIIGAIKQLSMIFFGNVQSIGQAALAIPAGAFR
jgi:hypothetical protein